MMMCADYNDPKTLWQRRAKDIGLQWYNGLELRHMTEVEAKAALDALSRAYGISYIWSD